MELHSIRACPASCHPVVPYSISAVIIITLLGPHGDLSPSPILGFAVVRLHHIYGNVYGKMGFSRGDRVCLHSSEFTRLIVFENLALTFLFVLKSRAAARREKKKEKKERKKIKTKRKERKKT